MKSHSTLTSYTLRVVLAERPSRESRHTTLHVSGNFARYFPSDLPPAGCDDGSNEEYCMPGLPRMLFNALV